MARRLNPVGGFFFVPDWILDSATEHDLSAIDVVIFLAVCSFAEGDLSVSVARQKIAEKAGVSLSTVKRSLPRWVDIGGLVDLGQSSRRAPRNYRIAVAKPLSPNRLGLPTRRAKVAGSGWLESLG